MVWLIVGLGDLEAGREQGGWQREQKTRERQQESKIGSIAGRQSGSEGWFEFKQSRRQCPNTWAWSCLPGRDPDVHLRGPGKGGQGPNFEL